MLDTMEGKKIGSQKKLSNASSTSTASNTEENKQQLKVPKRTLSKSSSESRYVITVL